MKLVGPHQGGASGARRRGLAWETKVMIKSGVLFAFALGILHVSGQTQGAGGQMRVELDAFSGRENPTWELSDEQTKEFVTTFESLGADDTGKSLNDGLGYRGFKVTGFRGYHELTVWKGVVHAVRAGKTFRWQDKSRSLERFLLKTSRTHIDEPVYKYVASEIEKD
jgi:hypothetical protein